MKWTVCGPLLIAVMTTSPVEAQSVISGEPCTGTLDGRKLGHLIPEQFPWKVLFERVAANSKAAQAEVHVDSQAMAILGEVGLTARQRAAAIEAAPLPSPELQADRDEEAAEAILAGRDTLIRRLAPGEFRKLQTWTEHSKHANTYRVALPGRVELRSGHTPVCILAVNGSQYPHLIQETYYWQMYFRANVAALSSARAPDGSPSASHIAAIQRHHARIPDEDVRIVLKIAEDTVTALNAIERKAERSSQFQNTLASDIAMIVMSARADLIRRLPESSWRAVREDARRQQQSSTAAFLLDM